ncbi:MAG TPA: Holliday junction resolvase [Anaerolineales bacterium]|nr:Holliday junction resolvase [Anaerolineales bacterium]
MQTTTFLSVLLTIAVIIITTLIYLLKERRREMKNIENEMRRSINSEYRIILEKWKKEFEKEIRKDAADRSRSTLIGKITEHFIPYLPDFAYNPQDARFLGAPIDFIIFDGLSEGEIKEIVFVEVKTNKGSLSKRERQLRDVLKSRRVRWMQMTRNVDLKPPA